MEIYALNFLSISISIYDGCQFASRYFLYYQIFQLSINQHLLNTFHYKRIPFSLSDSPMSSTTQLYLSQMQTLVANSKTHQKVKRLNSTVLDDIGNQIIQSHIVIPDHEKKLKLKPLPDQHQTQVTKIDGKYHEIQLKKKLLLHELQTVQNIETTFKMNLSSLKQSTVSTHIAKPPKFKSEFTPEEIAKIKQIYKNQKKFQRKIKTKLKKYQEDLERFKKQKEEQEQQKHRKLCMQKHEQREQYIKQIQQRNKHRQEMLKEQRQKINELKNKQKLFQRLEDSFLKEKELECEEVKRKLEEHKKKREFSFDDMKRHQEEYVERKRMKDEQRDENLRNFKNVNETKFPCLFLDKIQQQEESAALEEQERRQMARNFVQRKTAYAEQVRKQLHTKIKTMSESKLSAIKQAKIEPKWLNTPQKYQEGTKYMREINARLNKLPRKVAQKSDQNKPKLKNYLVELKNQDQDKKKQAKQKNVTSIANSVGIIAAKENITSTNLAKSVKAKLDLMCKLQSMQ